jgi:hypothetical protein
LNFLAPGTIQIDPDLELARLLGWDYVPKINGSLAAARILTDPTDWDAYNWASIYWRIAGNATEALECARKSVHYSPREYKDIGLHLMGMILHFARSGMSDDAIVVLQAALDHVLPLVQQEPWNEDLRRRTQVSALSVGVVAAILENYNRCGPCRVEMNESPVFHVQNCEVLKFLNHALIWVYGDLVKIASLTDGNEIRRVPVASRTSSFRGGWILD